MKISMSHTVRSERTCRLPACLYISNTWLGGVMVRASIGLTIERLRVQLPAVKLSG